MRVGRAGLLRLSGLGAFTLLLAVCARNSTGPAEPLLATRAGVQSGMPYAREPDWVSSESDFCGTGLALVDINGDGFEDIVVANGNDCGEQPLLVYFNDGKGQFPNPPWRSKESKYFFNLAAGDINGDGHVDLAVSTNVVSGSSSNPIGYVGIYLNRDGGLPDAPDYKLDQKSNTLACALGDVDGDGDLDLAMTTLSDAQGQNTPQYVFFNEKGTLSNAKPWVSSDATPSVGALFADVNQDGLLDLLVGAGPMANSRVYYGNTLPDGGIQLEATPASVIPTDTQVVMYLDHGAVDGDGGTASVLAYNGWNCTGGSCPPSFLEAYPGASRPSNWRSAAPVLGSGVMLADVTGDERLELLAASWTNDGGTRPGGGPLMIFPATEGSLATEPAYTSSRPSVGETLAAADLRHRGLRTATESFLPTNPRSVVTLSRQVIAKLVQVEKNGQVLPSSEYTSVPGRNWISFKSRLVKGDEVQVRYLSSSSLDIVLTNEWSGTFLFHHQ